MAKFRVSMIYYYFHNILIYHDIIQIAFPSFLSNSFLIIIMYFKELVLKKFQDSLKLYTMPL